ncbi:cutinase, partial [Pseudovirgaria hyperparasitica]
YVIVARASGEKPGYGILGPVKDEILSRVPDSTATAVSYPATITDPPYTESEPEGVGNMTELVKAYGDACPDGRMVLMGYSQGAQVVGDVLLGNKIDFFPITQPIDEKYRNQVTAAILMGDPTFVKNEPVNVGNATNVSTFPRPNNDWEELGLVGRVQSYCDARDYFCDRGDSVEIHVSYIGEYGTTAADYVVGKFN